MSKVQQRIGPYPSMPRAGLRCAVCVILWLVGTGTMPAFSQVAQMKVQSPPYFVGDPVAIEFTITGLDQAPEPQCTIESTSDDLRAQQGSVSPNVMSRTTYINGRVSQQTTVTWQIVYLLTAGKPGKYTVGPFVFKQGSEEVRVEAETFELEMSRSPRICECGYFWTTVRCTRRNEFPSQLSGGMRATLTKSTS